MQTACTQVLISQSLFANLCWQLTVPLPLQTCMFNVFIKGQIALTIGRRLPGRVSCKLPVYTDTRCHDSCASLEQSRQRLTTIMSAYCTEFWVQL